MASRRAESALVAHHAPLLGLAVAALVPGVVLGCASTTVQTGPAGPGVPGAPPTSTARVELIAGGGDGQDGTPAIQAQVIDPFGVSRDRAGNLYVAEGNGHRVRRIDPAGVISTVAGSARQKGHAGDGGPAVAAQLNFPHTLDVVPGTDDLLIADTFNNRVRKVDLRTGVITTVVGTGDKAFGGDGGPASAAQFSGIFCMAFDGGKKMYLVDLGNRRIRAVDLQSWVVTTVAGNGDKGVPADGSDALAAPLVDPRAVARDSRGNLYILERNGHALRVVDPAGKIRTVAGTGVKGFSGDGGDARAATFDGPKYLAVDPRDDVLIVDTENHAIRKYLPREGRVVRVAGTGVKGAGGIGGPPEALQLARPHGVFVDPSGSLIVSDSDNHRVVAIRP